MLTNYYILLTYVVKCVVLIDTHSKKMNIKGKQVEHISAHEFGYRKYYKDLFQSMDIHPQLYGHNVNNTKDRVRENFNDDVEHDKHTLIFQQVYKFYRKMLNKRKAEQNSSLNKVLKYKNKLKADINQVEEVMKNKISRLEHVNHKQVVKERRREIMEILEQKTQNDDLTHGNNTSHKQEHVKAVDTFKIKSILNDVEKYIKNKFGEHGKPDTAVSSEVVHETKTKIKNDLKGNIQNFFGFNKGGSSKRPSVKTKKTPKTTTTKPTTPNWEDWVASNNESEYEEETTRKVIGDGYWDRIKNRRINWTRRARMKTTWSSDEAMDYWKAWTPDPRYTFGLEEWNGSAVMNQTFFSYEEENATFTTLPANWLTWLYSGVSEDLANQTTYESCPTHEIVDRYYNTTWSLEFMHTKPKNYTVYWPNKDMFKYTFHTSDISEWDELEFHHSPPNPTYYERNRVTEYLTWRPMKRADFITTKRKPSTWTQFFYTNNSAEGLYLAPTVYWIDMRTPSKKPTPGSWQQVESQELTKPPSTLKPYPNPPINFTCYHCNGTPAVFSHENNLENHIVEHMKNGTYKVVYNSSEERRGQEMPVWDSYFRISQDTEEKRRGIKQTRMTDCDYASSVDYSHEMRNWNQSFLDRMKKRHAEGKSIEGWDRDSVVYQYYADLKPTTVFYDSDYYYNSAEWAELQVERKKRAEREQLMKNLKNYMSQNLTTFPGSILEESNEFDKKKKAKLWNSLEAFKREYLRNLTRTTIPTTVDPELDILRDLASFYMNFTTSTPSTTRKRRPFNIQDQIDQYIYSIEEESPETINKTKLDSKIFSEGSDTVENE
ncbi:hypothetical protein WDU94_002808 [Cyamophila willieti]